MKTIENNKKETSRSKVEKLEIKYTKLPETIRRNIGRLEKRLAVFYGSAERAQQAIEKVSDKLVEAADEDKLLSRACGRFVDRLPKDVATIAGLDVNLTLYGKLDPSEQDIAKVEREFLENEAMETFSGEDETETRQSSNDSSHQSPIGI
ncbi:MAG: hypothetical protein QM627_12280 [Luteolibacter sp.]